MLRFTKTLTSCVVATALAGLLAAADDTTAGGLYYESSGQGRAVVLIHAFQMDLRQWAEQVKVLEPFFHVVRYDVRNHGRSKLATEPTGRHDDLYRLLQELKIERASLVGLSMGGEIALDFALACPKLVDRLVLASPGISGSSRKRRSNGSSR